MQIRPLDPEQATAHLDGLADVLVDCVEGGASVSFMAGFSHEEAKEFFRNAVDEARRGNRQIYVALNDENRIVGTVQVILHCPPNQPHRGDVAKLLVYRDARNQGVGAKLMQAAEQGAREAGKTLLVLDTVEGESGERLYTRLGWQRVGVIPDYALYPDGRLCSTVYFYKRI